MQSSPGESEFAPDLRLLPRIDRLQTGIAENRQPGVKKSLTLDSAWILQPLSADTGEIDSILSSLMALCYRLENTISRNWGSGMGSMSVRNIPDDDLAALKRIAAQNGRSAESEVRLAISDLVRAAQSDGFGNRLHRKYGGVLEDDVVIEREKTVAEPMTIE